MDLSLLQSLRQQSTQLASQRHEKSDRAYNDAVAALTEAQASNFQDKVKLKAASNKFLKAIQLARGKVEPYVGMSYLLMIVGNERQAVRYLQHARDIDPNHEDVQKLLTYLQDPTAFAQAQETEASPELEDTETQQTEARKKPTNIHEFMAYISELNREVNELPKQAQLGESALRNMRDQMNTWDQKLLEVQEDIVALEATENVQILHRSLRVLEKQIENFNGVYRQSKQLTNLEQDIKKTHKEVLQHMGSGDYSPEALEDLLESYLDECDRIADLLDEADEKGVNIDPVAAPYENLAAVVERFQDYVDDFKNN